VDFEKAAQFFSNLLIGFLVILPCRTHYVMWMLLHQWTIITGFVTSGLCLDFQWINATFFSVFYRLLDTVGLRPAL